MQCAENFTYSFSYRLLEPVGINISGTGWNETSHLDSFHEANEIQSINVEMIPFSAFFMRISFYIFYIVRDKMQRRWNTKRNRQWQLRWFDSRKILNLKVMLEKCHGLDCQRSHPGKSLFRLTKPAVITCHVLEQNETKFQRRCPGP